MKENTYDFEGIFILYCTLDQLNALINFLNKNKDTL